MEVPIRKEVSMMRTGAITGFLALGIAAGALWAQPTLTHLKSVDLSSYFTASGPQGDSVSDVAFDGRNLYVAGFAVVNTTEPVPVGVLKISNVLSPDTNQWSYIPLISLTQAAQSRVSYVVYKDGSLYLGTGLGDDSGNPDYTGIRKFDATTGVLDSNWNNFAGVVMPSNLTPGTTTRMECLAIDPGFVGDPSRVESLAILARGRGYVFLRNLITGGAAGSMLCRPRRADNSIITTMRDITFNPANGDVYLRLEEGIWYAQRTGATSVPSGDATLILSLPSPALVLVNLLYLPTPSGDLLLANQRTNPPSAPYIQVYQVNGASLNLYTLITGSEPLPDGTTPPAFNFDIFNYTYGDGPDPSAGDVNLDGIVDDADLLAVLFAFGQTGSGLPEDVNSDGVVDDADLLTVLFNFGSNPTARYLFVVAANPLQGRDRLDIYRVNP
jgi:hypothetical protein